MVAQAPGGTISPGRSPLARSFYSQHGALCSLQSPPPDPRIHSGSSSHLTPIVQVLACKTEVGGLGKTSKESGVGAVYVGRKPLVLRPGHSHRPFGTRGTSSAQSAATRPRLGGPRRSPPPRERCLRTKSQGRAGHPACDPVEPGGGKRAGRRSSSRHAYWLEPTPIRAPRPDNWPAGAEFAEPQ